MIEIITLAVGIAAIVVIIITAITDRHCDCNEENKDD